MPTQSSPPLNGRNLAEYYISGESAKLSTLREYAKPLDEQQARILMYDPIRRLVPEYFREARNPLVLDRVANFLKTRHFPNHDYDATWHRSNELAIENLRRIAVNGRFKDITVSRSSITAAGIRVLSTVDFCATFVPKANNGIMRRVGVIVNPSGVKRPADKRRQWLNIECEVAYQAAVSVDPTVSTILYLDLQKQDVSRHVGPKKQIISEIEATCYRLLRDWRELRLQMRSDESESA